MTKSFVIYLAVLPRYRDACVEILRRSIGDQLSIFVSPAHLDSTVTTGIDRDAYVSVKMIRLFRGRAFIQIGGVYRAVSADTTLVDLNPRSLSAWWILLVRRAFRRRTLVWGHLYPQAGAESTTARLRRLMRSLASGTVTYSLDNLSDARRDFPGKKAWAAPNALYTAAQLQAPLRSAANRTDLIYVGRFEPAKKVGLAIEAFTLFSQTEPSARLVLVGGGSQESDLRRAVAIAGLEDRVIFAGWIDDVDHLRTLYATAFASLSPGFAGLGLTQSLGFGVPMVIADGEQHSPEIELAVPGNAVRFESNNSADFNTAIRSLWEQRATVPLENAIQYISRVYSADSMALGLEAALTDRETAHVASARQEAQS